MLEPWQLRQVQDATRQNIEIMALQRALQAAEAAADRAFATLRVEREAMLREREALTAAADRARAAEAAAYREVAALTAGRDAQVAGAVARHEGAAAASIAAANREARIARRQVEAAVGALRGYAKREERAGGYSIAQAALARILTAIPAEEGDDAPGATALPDAARAPGKDRRSQPGWDDGPARARARGRPGRA